MLKRCRLAYLLTPKRKSRSFCRGPLLDRPLEELYFMGLGAGSSRPSLMLTRAVTA